MFFKLKALFMTVFFEEIKVYYIYVIHFFKTTFSWLIFNDF